MSGFLLVTTDKPRGRDSRDCGLGWTLWGFDQDQGTLTFRDGPSTTGPDHWPSVIRIVTHMLKQKTPRTWKLTVCDITPAWELLKDLFTDHGLLFREHPRCQEDHAPRWWEQSQFKEKTWTSNSTLLGKLNKRDLQWDYLQVMGWGWRPPNLPKLPSSTSTWTTLFEGRVSGQIFICSITPPLFSKARWAKTWEREVMTC